MSGHVVTEARADGRQLRAVIADIQRLLGAVRGSVRTAGEVSVPDTDPSPGRSAGEEFQQGGVDLIGVVFAAGALAWRAV